MEQILHFSDKLNTGIKQTPQAQYATLDQFLASVERRALITAEVATGNRDDGMDLVQDSMLAFVSRYSNKSVNEWAPLFHRVLQNRIRDWYRKNEVKKRWKGWFDRKKENDDHDPIQTVADPVCRTPDKLVGLERSANAMTAALEALPLRQQQAFFLRIWEGLDVTTTAKVMGCSNGSVKTHLSRARKSLQLTLEEHYR